MKSLEQVEPRRPISSVPITISEAGSYYLTGNLQMTEATNAIAITIAASGVTLDLMGFTLSSVTGVNADAIRINAGLRDVTIRNGVIAGNSTVSVTGSAPDQTWTQTLAGFSIGVSAASANNCHFSNLRISGCRAVGLRASSDAVVEHITATQNTAGGISASSGATVIHSVATLNGGAGITAPSGSVSHCIARQNDGFGINAESVANSIASGNNNTGLNATSGSVSNCVAEANDGVGIAASFGSVSNSRASGNSTIGINASQGSVVNSIATSNGEDGIFIPAGVVAFCKAAGNNMNASGSVDIDGIGATRTGNNPTP